MYSPNHDLLEPIYGSDAERASLRFEELAHRFLALYPHTAASPAFFSSPGRTEIIGNHTDHNGGKVLAASITMDTIGVAARNGTERVSVTSEGYPTVELSLSALEDIAHGSGTPALLAGMFEAMRNDGWKLEGFNAVVSSDVIPAAGVSSSASFEMLICAIVNHLFNEGSRDEVACAHVGHYAENVWWNKASGLLDQLACAVGGTILLDFSEGVSFKRLDFLYDQLGCDLVLVNTGQDHADLSEEYSSVPLEMRRVAEYFGVSRLCDMSETELIAQTKEVRDELRCDRAIMRALHYFEECRRVDDATIALERGEKARVLELINESGSSSWRWLQNAYVPGNVEQQAIPLALARSELFLHGVGGGACRLHGGGFAGVIACVVPKEHSSEYVRVMSDLFGQKNVYPTNIRATGTVCVAMGEEL